MHLPRQLLPLLLGCVSLLLSLRPEAAISIEPPIQFARNGDTVSFQAVATGATIEDLQWLRAGTPIPGATNQTLILTNLSARQEGTYSARVTTTSGDTSTADAQLQVCWRVEFLSFFTNSAPADVRFDQEGNEYSVTRVQEVVSGVLRTVTFHYEKASPGGGTVLWEGDYRPELPFDRLHWIIARDGGLYLVGYSTGSATIIRIDSTGKELWTSEPLLEQGLSEHTYGSALAEDHSGNLYVPVLAANTQAPGVTNKFRFTKFGPNGIPLWKTASAGMTSENQPLVIIPTALAVDSSNHLILSGRSPVPSAGGRFADDIITSKLTSNGTELWASEYIGTDHPHPYSILTDLDDNVFVSIRSQNIETGQVFSGTHKYDKDGRQQWAVGPSGWGNSAAAVALDFEGNLYLSLPGRSWLGGPPRSAFVLCKFDTSGRLLWFSEVPLTLLPEGKTPVATQILALGPKVVVHGYAYRGYFYNEPTNVVSIRASFQQNNAYGVPIFREASGPLRVVQGDPATFSMLFDGAAPLSFQWLYNGQVLPMETNSTISLASAQEVNSGTYTVRATNAVDCAISDDFKFFVLQQPSFTILAAHPHPQNPAARFLTVVIRGQPLVWVFLESSTNFSEWGQEEYFPLDSTGTKTIDVYVPPTGRRFFRARIP